MKKKFLLSLFFLLFSAANFFSQETVGFSLVGRPIFSPEIFYLGDNVTCRIRIQLDPGYEIKWDQKQEFSNRSDFYIREVKIYPRHDRIVDVDILFIPFYPQLRLPSLQLGEIQLPEIIVNTFSGLREKNEKLEGLRGQKYLSYTQEMIVIFVFFILLLLIALILSSEKRRKKIFAKLFKKRKIRPLSKINVAIDELVKNNKVYTSRNFYSFMTEILRDYLSEVFKEDFYSCTVREMEIKLDSRVSDKRIVSQVVSIMNFADSIKFSGQTATLSKKKQDLVSLRRTIVIIEKELILIRKKEIDAMNSTRKRRRNRFEHYF